MKVDRALIEAAVKTMNDAAKEKVSSMVSGNKDTSVSDTIRKAMEEMKAKGVQFADGGTWNPHSNTKDMVYNPPETENAPE